MNQVITVTGMSNREFLEAHARPGRVGLSGGNTLVDRAITRAESRLDERGRGSLWSHAFVFQGRRLDGHEWLIESDLQLHRKHIRLGVQENRVANYFDEDGYPRLAVLDFHLDESQVGRLLGEALELVARRTRYSLRELAGTWLALRHDALRRRENLLAREQSLFCSAFVHHLFRKCGIDLAPGLAEKHTTPEDISRTQVPHATYVLQRKPVRSRLRRVQLQVRKGIRSRMSRLRGPGPRRGDESTDAPG